MPHFYCPPKNIVSNRFTLTREESHHILNVLRKKIGDSISIFDGEGNIYSAEITGISDGVVSGNITDASPVRSSFVPVVRLYVSIPKKQKIEEIIEKAAQLGVSEICPVISARTIVKIDKMRDEKKLKRWNSIALAASKQSGRSDVLKIVRPMSYAEAVASVSKDDFNIIAWEGERGSTLKDILRQQNARPLSRFNLFVGPEGGYSVAEVECAKKNGFAVVGLGENILKTDTAAIVLATIIIYEMGR